VLADYRYVGPFIDQLTYLNDVVRSTTWDAGERPTVVDHVEGETTIAKSEYGYDDNGNPLYEKRAHDSDKYDVWEYDDRDVLVRSHEAATTSSAPETHDLRTTLTLDGERNITARAEDVGEGDDTTEYTVDSRNRYTAIGAASPSWTDAAELEDDDAGQGYVWNWRGEVVSATKDSSTYTFEHDALGRRITTDFGTELRFTWAGERIVEEITADSTPTVNATWVWGMDPEPVRMERGEDTSLYHASRDG
jgi:hypothetical protein